MGKFDKVAKTQSKVMVRFQELAGEAGVWATCSQAVKDFASKNFKTGDTVNVQYEETPNSQLKYHVTRIEKGNGTDTKKGATAPDTGKPTCEDCHKELKDDKYKKCWACNEKNPVKKSYGKKSYDKSPEVQASIKRQAIGHMTSRTLIALQGHIDQNTIIGVMETIYKKYQELVG